MPIKGQRLKAIRESRGYSQEELAELVGVSTLQLYRYESGKNDATGEVISQFAKVLGVTADYLLGNVDDPKAYLKEEDLTPDEFQILHAYRRGDLKAVLKILSSPTSKIEDKPNISGT